MKIIYYSPINSETISVGIWNKIETQLSFFKSSDFEIEFIDTTFKKNNIFRKILKRLPFFSINNWKIDKKSIVQSDAVYIRYSKSDVGLLKMLYQIKKINKNLKILIEIPTYPYDNEEDLTFNNFFILIEDKIYRNYLKYFCDRVLTFSDDDMIWGMETINLSNSVNFDNINPIDFKEKGNTINLIGVATLSFWHGYDRLIEGLAIYYNTNYTRDIVFHIVGDGPSFTDYKNLVEKYNLQSKVIFHGRLTGKELDTVYSISHIGIDALGRHRSGVTFNSSLKGKEYGAKGLPIVSGVKTELDSFYNFEFYHRVDASDKPIDIYDILNFYDAIYEKSNRKEISDRIIQFNKDNFDINTVWRPVIEFIKERK